MFMDVFVSQIPPNSTESLGIMVLKSRGVFVEAYWYWLGVGATIGYIFLFNFFYTLALKYLDRKCLCYIFFSVSKILNGQNFLIL